MGVLASACRRPRETPADVPPVALRSPFRFLCEHTELLNQLLPPLISLVAEYLPCDEPIAISVRTVAPKWVDIADVYLDDTVWNLKERICESEGIPPEQQILVCNATQLRDQNPLHVERISQLSVITLRLRLRGS